MIKEISKRILAVFLTAFTLIFTLGLSTPAASAEEIISSSATSYISEVYVSPFTNKADAKKDIADQGYTLIDHNFNENSKNVKYIGYKRTNNPEEALTGLLLSKTSTTSMLIYRGRTYYRVLAPVEGQMKSVNLNDDDDQMPLYLYYTHENAPYDTTEYLTALDAVV